MDKYEYKLKTEQMLELMENGAYNKAAEIADAIDWKRVRNATMLTNVSDIYEKNGDYQKSYEVLNIAYHRAEGSRKVLYRLCTLALKTGNVDEAIDYYDDFMQVAPKDPNQHILRYKILRARRAPIEQQIEALEEFKKAEYIEEWAYELAKLYQEAGMTAECLEECDDLILWFSEGKFVFKAMELKMQYKPLTPSQQEKYDHRYEKLESETEEIPDLTQYQARKAEFESEKLDREELDEEAERELEENLPSTSQQEEVTQQGVDLDNTVEMQIPTEEELEAQLEGEQIEEPEEEPEVDETIQRLEEKGIGSRMKLQDALMSLLGPKPEDEPDVSLDAEDDEMEEDIPELESAIEEIEAVVDLELVNELANKSEAKRNGIRFDSDLEELKAEPLEEEELLEESEEIEDEIIPEESEEIEEEIIPEKPEEMEEELQEISEEPEEETELLEESEDLEVEEDLPEELVDTDDSPEISEEIEDGYKDSSEISIDIGEEEDIPEEVEGEEILEVSEELEEEEDFPKELEELEEEEDFPEISEESDVEEDSSEELEELVEEDIPEISEEIEEDAEDILSESGAEEVEIEADSRTEEQELLVEEEPELEEDSIPEEYEDESLSDFEEEELEEFEEDPETAEDTKLEFSRPAAGDQIDGQLSIEDILMDWKEEPAEEVEMEDKKKKVEPILPPDIQRMIDEIEGVLPEEPEPVRPARRETEDVRENMGAITQQLRIDDIAEFLSAADEPEDNLDDFSDMMQEELFEDAHEDSYGDRSSYVEEEAAIPAQDEAGQEFYSSEYPVEDDIVDEYVDEQEDEYAGEELYEDDYDDSYSESYEAEEDYPVEEDYAEEDAYTEEYEDEYEDDYVEEEEYTDEYEDEYEGDYVEEEEYTDEYEDEYEGDYAEEDAYTDEYEDEYAEEDAYTDEYEDGYEDDYVEEEEYTDEYEDDYADGYSDEEYDVADSYEEADYEDIEASFEEEFRPNPAHANEPDDREIPDDDDEMDILSATTPLSRKETAKLIATGKTSPLPLDEISDALSLSDTGFVVHGRYDLAAQSGIGTRAGLTEEQKKLFSYFVPVRGMSEQLVDVLEQDRNCTNREGTSRTGNLLIIGNKGNGKTVLAVDVVKAIQKQRNIRQGKVAIVTGDSLNKKKIGDIFDKLYGGALIIEKASKMNEKTVARMNKAMERDTGEMLIVLEEQRKPLDRLLSSNREFRRKFTSRLEVPIFINDELVTFGQTYAQENGYRIDEMGILALYSRIDALQREDHAVTVAEVKEVMDEAMAHSQKASAKKLVKRVFGKNTDDADRIILSEKDFNI